jgi:hypothetical protein
MTINDVIREAKSEHEIYFLVTAYVEAVRYCDRLSFLPAQVRELPIKGMDDFQKRIDGLKAELGKSSAQTADSPSRVVVKETADVLGDALQRLEWLKREQRKHRTLHA